MLERCSHVRIGSKRVPLTSPIKERILKLVGEYGTGGDTLRCLALGTIDNPQDPKTMDLIDSTKFVEYEV